MNAKKLIEIAEAEIGYTETFDNLTKYGDLMKANGLPWCGSFVNWCAKKAKVKIPNTVSTVAGSSAFKKNKQWSDAPATPEPGWMITRELLRALLQIAARVPIAGMDILEVSPPYDWAESTAMIANRAALEVISSLAKRKAAGETIRWEPGR
jgi:hypothetical protein